MGWEPRRNPSALTITRPTNVLPTGLGRAPGRRAPLVPAEPGHYGEYSPAGAVASWDPHLQPRPCPWAPGRGSSLAPLGCLVRQADHLTLSSSQTQQASPGAWAACRRHTDSPVRRDRAWTCPPRPPQEGGRQTHLQTVRVLQKARTAERAGLPAMGALPGGQHHGGKHECPGGRPGVGRRLGPPGAETGGKGGLPSPPVSSSCPPPGPP